MGGGSCQAGSTPCGGFSRKFQTPPAMDIPCLSAPRPKQLCVCPEFPGHHPGPTTAMPGMCCEVPGSRDPFPVTRATPWTAGWGGRGAGVFWCWG